MKVTNVQTNDLFLTFQVQDTNAAFVNSIRRAVIDLVPTMAIEDVEFRQNSSAVFDEMFAHRLGLVPLTTDLQSYTFRTDEGSAANQCTMTMEVKGPGQVTADLLQSSDDKIKPVFGAMPVAELLEHQEVSIEVKAILGRGVEHAKWSSGTLYYQPKATVTVGNVNMEEVQDKLPSQAINNGKVDVNAIYEHNLVDAVEGVSPDITVEYDPTTYSVTVESFGQHAPKNVMLIAADELRSQLKELSEAMQ